MNERVIENWLTNINEKSFQTPFCQMLIAEGYKVIHLSRHGSFEEGKDVLAIDPTGTPCAFQLKGSNTGKITQAEWSKYHEQIVRLVEIPINHPSIDRRKRRKVFFVTNGEIEEEVRIEIRGLNDDWENRGHPKLETIVKGELLQRFLNIHTNLWPENLQSEKELLSLYLANGKSYLNKPDFINFIEKMLNFEVSLSQQKSRRLIANLSLLICYILHPYIIEKNHISVIEGWTILLAYLVSYIEKNNLNKNIWDSTIKIIESEIDENLNYLYDEIQLREHYVEGNPFVDSFFYRGRITILLGYISYYFISGKINDKITEPEDWHYEFIFSNLERLQLWGEGAIPSLLAVIWGLNVLGFYYQSNCLLVNIFLNVLLQSQINDGLPDPYEDFPKIVMQNLKLTKKNKEITYLGISYSLQSLIFLISRRNIRGVIFQYWKQITNVIFCKVVLNHVWEFGRWKCDDGTYSNKSPNHTQSWKNLVEEANNININSIPKYFQNNPDKLLLYIFAVPHRLNSDLAIFLDEKFVCLHD